VNRIEIRFHVNITVLELFLLADLLFVLFLSIGIEIKLFNLLGIFRIYQYHGT